VQATLDAYPDWRIAAQVITPVPTADRQKATVKVRIAFGELDARILPDMGVKVSFLAEETAAEGAASAPAALVSEKAVRSEGGQSVTFVFAGDKVERRAVKVGGRHGDRLEVIAGLSSGEQVVVEGPSDLADGDRVTPKVE
jgi:hypothetical protein